MNVKFKLKDGSIVTAEKDCDCIAHDGPCWLHYDQLLEKMNKKYFNPEKPTAQGFRALAIEESMRLRDKLWEMECRGIVEIIHEKEQP